MSAAATANVPAASASGQPKARHAVEPNAEADGGGGGDGAERDDDGDVDAAGLDPRRREHPMRHVSGENAEQRADQKHRVGRAPIETDAGDDFVDRAEDGRVGAERVEQHHDEREREEADFAIPELAAEQPDRHQQERQGADVHHADVLRDVEFDVRPRQARRPPVLAHSSRRAEDVGCQERQQQGGMQRAAAGAGVVDLGSVGVGGKQRRHQDRQAMSAAPTIAPAASGRNARRSARSGASSRARSQRA